MRIIYFLFLVFTANSAFSQTDFNEAIIGTWRFDSVVGDMTDSEKNSLMNTDILLTFQPDNSLEMEVEGFALEVSYTLEDALLIIGKTEYVITKIEGDVMSLKPNIDGTNLRYTYKRKPRNG